MLQSKTFLTRVSTTQINMKSTHFTAKEKHLLWIQMSQLSTNLKKWLTSHLDKWFLCTTRHLLFAARPKFCFSNKKKTLKQVKKIGFNTMKSRFVDSFTTSKEISVSKWLLTTKYTSTWLIRIPWCRIWKTLCTTTWAAIKWCSEARFGTVSLTNKIKRASTFTPASTCTILRCASREKTMPDQ